MKVLESGGVKVYELSSTKNRPQWLTDTANGRRKLAKDPEYRKRVELIQDFECPTAAYRIKASKDGNYIFVAGGYPPMIKCYDTRELSLKFERRVDSEIVQFEILSDDFTKLVLLGDDRQLYFHAAYGNHYKTRIPTFGRDLCYNRQSSDLFVASSSPDIYRLNLERGQFMEELTAKGAKNDLATGVNVINYNPDLHLLVAGTENGFISCFDTRAKPKPVISVDVGSIHEHNFGEVTALEFDSNDYLKFGVGGSQGIISLFDIRSVQPELNKEHLNELPIIHISYQNPGNLVISADKMSIKVWDKVTGQNIATTQSENSINDVFFVTRRDGFKKDTSGLLLAAAEQSQIMSFYIPELGPAPKWCSFLDTLTEELEEEQKTGGEQVYQNHKFITKAELEILGLEHLASSKFVKSYMHGFFMDLALYNNIKSLLENDSNTEEAKKQREKKIAGKLRELAGDRIKPKRKRVLVNRELLETGGDKIVAKDSRFGELFEDPDFEIDKESEAFKKVFSMGSKKLKKKLDSDEKEEEEEEVEEEIDEQSVEADDASISSHKDEDEKVRTITVLKNEEKSNDNDSESEEDTEALWKLSGSNLPQEKKTTVRSLGGGNIEMSFIPASKPASKPLVRGKRK